VKILLVDPPWYALQNIFAATVSLGLASIAGVLEARGHEVHIFNGDLYTTQGCGGESTLSRTMPSLQDEHPAYLRLRKVLRQTRPEAVGITSMTAEYPSACTVARIVREECDEVPIVIGGVHPTLIPEEVIAHDLFDYVVIGEGEETATALFDVLGSGGNPGTVAGIGYRHAGSVVRTEERPLIENLDAIPLPSYRGLIDRLDHKTADLGGVITSRGCPYLCLYCASKALWTRRVRFRSIERVLEEISGLYQDGVRLFRLHDDTFTIKEDRVRVFCDGMKSFPGVRWSCDTRVDLLGDSLAVHMRAAGCYQVNLGIESGSERIRSLFAKNVDVARARQLVHTLQRYGIRVTAYFMAGFPTETGPELDATIALARMLSPDNPLFSVFTPYPGTELWNSLQREGKIPERPDYGSYFHHSEALNFSAMDTNEFSARMQAIHAYETAQTRTAALRRLLRHPFIFLSDRKIMREQHAIRIDGHVQ